MRINGIHYALGERVRIKNIKDGNDEDLNGQIGRVAYKHRNIPFGCIGVYIGPDRVRANLQAGEFEKLEDETK